MQDIPSIETNTLLRDLPDLPSHPVLDLRSSAVDILTRLDIRIENDIFYLDRLWTFSVLMFKGDNSVLRILSADVKSFSSSDSRNFCSLIKNNASSREAFSCRGIFDKCDSAFAHAPERTAVRNSETSLDSVLKPDSSDNVLEA